MKPPASDHGPTVSRRAVSRRGFIRAGAALLGVTIGLERASAASAQTLADQPAVPYALKPSASDSIAYVTVDGSDSADGLSWGTAKATIGAAYAALRPTGGTICLGAGTFAEPSTIQVV